MHLLVILCLEFIVDNIPRTIYTILRSTRNINNWYTFYYLTNVLYANLYKVGKRGKEYLIVASKMVVLAFVLNVFAAYVLKDSVMIAYATLITLIVWYVYSSFDFKGLEIHSNEIIHFIVYVVSYQIIKIIPFPSLIKAFMFLICMVLSEYILFNSDFKDVISMIKNRNRKNLKDKE